MAFKENLTQLMNLYNLGNIDIASAIQVDASVVSRWRSGARQISLNSPHLYNLSKYILMLPRNKARQIFIDKVLIISLSESDQHNPALQIKALMDWLVTEHSGRVDPVERAVFDKSPVAIAITREGRILFANRTCLDMLGATATSEIRGRQLTSFFKPGGRPVEIDTELINLPDGPAQSNFIFDISDKKYLENKYSYQLSVRQLLLDISKAFARSFIGDIDELINQTLQKIALFDGCERCFVYQYSENRQNISNTYEWCAEGVTSHRQAFQNMPASMMAWWHQRNLTQDYLYIPDIAALPDEAASERRYLQNRQVKSLLTVPIIQAGQVTGLLGFAAFSAIRLWSDESIQLLEFVAQILADRLAQKKYYDEIKTSELYYKLMFAAGEAKLIIDQEGRIIEANEHFHDLTGHQRSQIIGKKWLSIVTAADHQAIRMQKSDGSDLYLQLTMTSIPGQPLQMATLIDQTEIVRLNRRLEAIRACNRAILTSGNDVQLMQSVCEDLVRIGGYRLVWLGAVSRDEVQSLQVLARAGYHLEYTDRLDIALSSPLRGNGPAGQAIKQNDLVICHDLEHNPSFEPWREDAVRFGYRSLISLPFRVSTQDTRYVISIYSDKTDSFDPGEVDLLQGLITSLSYGLQAQRQTIQ